jgi:hypothetical protein
MSDAIKRGWALTTFLIVAGMVALFGIALDARLFSVVPNSPFPVWMIRTFLLVSILRLAAAIAIWCWLRLGVVLYVTLTLLVIPITFSHGYKSTVFSLFGIALLVYLVRDKWQHMRWSVLPANNRWSGP